MAAHVNVLSQWSHPQGPPGPFDAIEIVFVIWGFLLGHPVGWLILGILLIFWLKDRSRENQEKRPAHKQDAR